MLTLFVVFVVDALSFVLVIGVYCYVGSVPVLCPMIMFLFRRSYERQRTRTWNKEHEQQ